MTSEIHLTPTGHAKDCDWHVDQYPWECTCGFIPRKKAMDNLIAQDADLIDTEPVAYRYGFDGYGWQYIDNGSGSDWTTRHPDAEPLYAHSPADRIETLEAALREVFEQWAGSEGFIPETAPEAYLLQLTKRMADIARAALAGDRHDQ